jgi:hypothetical protein
MDNYKQNALKLIQNILLKNSFAQIKERKYIIKYGKLNSSKDAVMIWDLGKNSS